MVVTRWWFQIFFIFIPTWGNNPVWLIFFKWRWNHQLDTVISEWISWLFLSWGLALEGTAPLKFPHYGRWRSLGTCNMALSSRRSAMLLVSKFSRDCFFQWTATGRHPGKVDEKKRNVGRFFQTDLWRTTNQFGRGISQSPGAHLMGGGSKYVPPSEKGWIPQEGQKVHAFFYTEWHTAKVGGAQRRLLLPPG